MTLTTEQIAVLCIYITALTAGLAITLWRIHVLEKRNKELIAALNAEIPEGGFAIYAASTEYMPIDKKPNP